jgi:hypothetical protein
MAPVAGSGRDAIVPPVVITTTRGIMTSPMKALDAPHGFRQPVVGQRKRDSEVADADCS